jgi:phosphopantothenoylcysteine decarboxylase
LVILPLTANTLGKISNGLCDNLLTCVVRAWDFTKSDSNFRKNIMVCPAMNTHMFEHPITAKQLSFLQELGFIIL